MKCRVAIVLSHPIQYNSPLFVEMNKRDVVDFKVFYTWSQSKDEVFDKNFGQIIRWDIPLLEGYDYTFVKNISPKPGTQYFKGLINPDLISKIEAYGATDVVVFGWNHHSHYKVLKHFKGKIPVYFRGDSTLLDEKPGLRTLLRRVVLTRIYRHIDFAYYVGQNNKEYFTKHGLKENQLIFAPHVIDNERFYDATDLQHQKASDERKLRLAIRDDNPIVLFVGKFEPKKNPMLLMHAAELMPDLTFVFVGDGVLKDQMRAKAEFLHNVRFLPFQNQSKMPETYRLGDVYVLPSSGPGETWGLAINEAMACGTAVICSNKAGCSPDLIIEGKTGYEFDADDLEDLVDKIRLAMSHHAELGNNALQHIKQFDVNACVDRLLSPWMR